jgi:VIT1/CCC1 family predicted Fe2+/Mn2+ transporter
MPEHHHEHRDVAGGAARAAVFGISDGLVSNVGLILGVAGASVDGSVVRVAGLAGLIAGAISMAAGEYNSMRVQKELLERELAIEERELLRHPHGEMLELAHIYQSRGMDAARARELAEATMADPAQALEVHAREELGIDPNELGSPIRAAVSSFVAFSFGALIPLVPWFFASGNGATVASLALALLTAAVVGIIVSRFTERNRLATVARQVAFTAVPAAITFAVGSAVGVTV